MFPSSSKSTSTSGNGARVGDCNFLDVEGDPWDNLRSGGGDAAAGVGQGLNYPELMMEQEDPFRVDDNWGFNQVDVNQVMVNSSMILSSSSSPQIVGAEQTAAHVSSRTYHVLQSRQPANSAQEVGSEQNPAFADNNNNFPDKEAEARETDEPKDEDMTVTTTGESNGGATTTKTKGKRPEPLYKRANDFSHSVKSAIAAKKNRDKKAQEKVDLEKKKVMLEEQIEKKKSQIAEYGMREICYKHTIEKLKAQLEQEKRKRVMADTGKVIMMDEIAQIIAASQPPPPPMPNQRYVSTTIGFIPQLEPIHPPPPVPVSTANLIRIPILPVVRNQQNGSTFGSAPKDAGAGNNNNKFY